jgi:hypothetical protein
VGKGAKIAIGCVVAFIVVVGGVCLALFGAAWWTVGKAKEYASAGTAKIEEISKYQTKANENPFTPPADGVIQEDRLRKFLDVRKQMYVIYQAHQADIDRAAHKESADLTDLAHFGGLVSDLELAKEKGLAGVGMSDGEYVFMQMTVYKTQMASKMQQETGKQLGETMAEAARQNKDALRKTLEAAARAAGQAPNGTAPAVSEDDLKQAEAAVDEAAGQAEATKALDSPQANIDLFRKYEADINKYAMTGLSFMGL